MRARRLSLVAVLATVTVLGGLPVVGTASADVVATVVAAPEYGADERHDALDYDQATDMIRDRDVARGVNFENVSPSQVLESSTAWIVPADTDWYVSPVWMTFPHTAQGATSFPDGDPGALPDQYDGLSIPIDADRYTWVSIRIHAERGTSSALYVDWFACQEYRAECMGRMRLDGVDQGWNTYTVPIENTPGALDGATQAWDGTIHGMRLGGPQGAQDVYNLDWFRVFEPGTTITLDDVPFEPRYESVDGPARTGDMPPTDGRQLDVASLPEGRWRIFEDGRTFATVTVTPRPRPEVLDPDVRGGDDFATQVLGNPWDFTDDGDVVRVANSVGVQYSGGELSAVSTTNDPYVQLPLGDDGLDPRHYHRVTVDQHYDAEFNLDDSVSGGQGGSHGRLIWRTRQHPAGGCAGYSDGREMVYFKYQDVYSYVMRDVLPAQVTGSSAEPNIGVPGCSTPDPHWAANGPLTYLRYDPHEAPTNYRWYLDELRIAADDAADPAFDVTWRDADAPEGTVMTVRLDTDREGFDGERIGRVTKRDGQVEFAVRWDAVDRLPGETYWVNVTSVAPDGTVGRDYSTGPLVVSPRIAGTNRVETAVELSRQSFDRADAAVVATSRDFPDALVAAQLADALGAPLLLTGPTSLDDAVRGELARLGAARVVVTGGERAVSAEVAAALAEGGRDVSRIGGVDRYETATQVARRAIEVRGRNPAEVVVATGTDFPDALAAGPWIGYADTALVLARPKATPPPPEPGEEPVEVPDPDNDVTRRFVADVDGPVAVVGGTNAVSADVARDVAAGQRLRRVAGTDRFETGRLLADLAVEAGASAADVLVATGRSFPDALAAGPAALARGGVLLLTERRELPTPTRRWLRAAPDVDSFRVVGGFFAVTHATVRALQANAGL